jgi:thioredoxin 1
MAKVTLVDYWAPWCGPCKAMAPILEEIKKELGDELELKEINVDEAQDVARQNGVMGIPTYVILKDNKEVGRQVGMTSKAKLLQLIQS